MSLSDVIDPEEGIGSSVVATAFGATAAIPLVFYYGYENIMENLKLYKLLIEKIADCVNRRLELDTKGSLEHFISSRRLRLHY